MARRTSQPQLPLIVPATTGTTSRPEATDLDIELVNALLHGADSVFVKRLARNDRSWADLANCHQGGPYIPSAIQDKGFFPKLAQRPDHPHIFDAYIPTWWPQTGARKRSHIVHYSNKGREYHFTGVPKPVFRGLAPASLLLVARKGEGDERIWWGMTLDSEGEAAAYVEDLLELDSSFRADIFDADEIRRKQDGLDDFERMLLEAVTRGNLPEVLHTLGGMPSPAEIAREAQQRYMAAHGLHSLNPYEMEAPGDAVRIISRDIEFAIYRAHERRIRAAQLLSELFAEGTTLANVVITAVRRFTDLYGLFLSASQQRKARAGQSFELHIRRLLADGGLPFDEQATVGRTRPDFLLPSSKAYRQGGTGDGGAIVLSLKTTLRERWKQVIKEMRGCPLYLATVDDRIASSAIEEMADSGITLVVPESLKSDTLTEYGKHRNAITFGAFFGFSEKWQRG